MKTVVRLIPVCLLLSGCAVTVSLYKPTTAAQHAVPIEGEAFIGTAYCRGPFAHYRLDLDQGVVGRLSAVLQENATNIAFDLRLERGTTFQFKESALSIEESSAPQFFATQIPLAPFRFRSYKLHRGTYYHEFGDSIIPSATLLEGRARNEQFAESPGVDPEEVLVDRFHSSTKVLPSHPSWISVQLPVMSVNGKEIKIDPLRFDKVMVTYYQTSGCGY